MSRAERARARGGSTIARAANMPRNARPPVIQYVGTGPWWRTTK